MALVYIEYVRFLSLSIWLKVLFSFQYSQGLKPILQLLSVAMASYEDWYRGTKEDPVKQLLNSLLKVCQIPYNFGQVVILIRYYHS